MRAFKGRILLNAAALKLGWIASVLGAAQGWTWFGPLVVLSVVALHLATVGRAGSELRLLVLAGALGFTVDSALAASHVVRYEAAAFGESLAPPWILGLWLLLATALRHSLGGLRGRLWLAALLGGIAGPLGYAAGHRLGALELHPERWFSLGLLAVLWALIIPLLLLAASRHQLSRPRPSLSRGKP